MRAILIDPWERVLATIELISAKDDPVRSLHELYKLVGEDGLDFAYIMPGESIAVGDNSALHNPPLPSYRIHGYHEVLYGRGVVIGYRSDGSERETLLTVDMLSHLIHWNSP